MADASASSAAAPEAAAAPPPPPPPPEVIVEFRHAGGAPILKKEKAKVRIPANQPFSTAKTILRKLLSLTSEDPLV